MDRRTRICVWIIIGGMINFLLFTLIYFAIEGDARNGKVTKEVGSGEIRYYVQMRADGPANEVAQGWFIYSAIHSLSIWITIAAVLLAMLTLAKDHIINALSESHGRALISIFAFVVIVAVIIMTTVFLMDFRYQLKHPIKVTPDGKPIPTVTTPPAASVPLPGEPSG